MVPTILYRRVDGIFVIVHSGANPSDAEWDACLEVSGRELPNYTGMLVFSAGGGPNSSQRAKMALEKRYNAIRTAVLTDSVVVRGMMTALAWLGRDSSRAFKPTEIDRAMAYLQMSSDARQKVGEALQELRQQIESKVA